jgi:hypothetical protein
MIIDLSPTKLFNRVGEIGARLRQIESAAWSSSDEERRLEPETRQLIAELSEFASHVRALPWNSASHDEICALIAVASNNFFVKKLIDKQTVEDLRVLTECGLDALARATPWVPDGLKGMRTPNARRGSSEDSS